MRAFAAFDLPEPVRDEIAAVVEDLRNIQPRGVNWVPPENLHITLLYLGDVPSSQTTRIDSAMRDTLASTPPFTLRNARIEVKPAHKPRLIWVRFDTDYPQVFKLPGKLRDALAPLGVESDPKALKLHCTLGRVKSLIDEHTIAEMMRRKLTTTAFTIDQASLYESRLRPQGPVYSQLRSYELR